MKKKKRQRLTRELTEAIETCESGLREAGKVLPPEQKAKVIMLIHSLLFKRAKRSTPPEAA